MKWLTKKKPKVHLTGAETMTGKMLGTGVYGMRRRPMLWSRTPIYRMACGILGSHGPA
jgi:hypothetical protein